MRRLRYKDVWLCGCVEEFFDPPPAGGVSTHDQNSRAGAIFLKLFFGGFLKEMTLSGKLL